MALTLQQAAELFIADFYARSDVKGLATLVLKTNAQQKADLKAFLLAYRDKKQVEADELGSSSTTTDAQATDADTLANTL